MAETPRDDDDIRSALRAGGDREREAFRLLRERYGELIYTCAYRLLGSHAEAEDLRQEVFIKVFERRTDFAGVTMMGAYLWKMTTRLAYSSLRKTRRRATKDRVIVAEAEHDAPSTPAVDANDDRAVRVLLECLDEIDETTRGALYLRELYELSWDEIATEVDLMPATARIRVSRALAKLKSCLEGREKKA